MPTSGQEQTPFSEKGTLVCVQGGGWRGQSVGMEIIILPATPPQPFINPWPRLLEEKLVTQTHSTSTATKLAAGNSTLKI